MTKQRRPSGLALWWASTFLALVSVTPTAFAQGEQEEGAPAAEASEDAAAPEAEASEGAESSPDEEAAPPESEESASEPDQAAHAGGSGAGEGGECTAQDVLRGLCEEATTGGKWWRVMGRIDYVQPIVLDQDPETDVQLFYYLGGEIDLPLLDGLYATAWIGMQQRFWTVEGELPVDFIDPFLGIGYRHSVGLGDYNLIFVHRLAAFLPLSRASRANLYYTALDWITASRLPIGHGFMVGVNLRAQYRFHEYAEAVGYEVPSGWAGNAGMNTRLRLEGSVLVQQQLFNSHDFGSLLVQAGIGMRYQLRYPSRDDFEDPASDQNFWEQDYQWSLSTTYTPIEYLSITLSLQHGYSDVTRGGVRNIWALDRDETSLALTLFARY